MSSELLKDILIATVPLLVIFPSLFAFTTWAERKALARIQKCDVLGGGDDNRTC